MEILHLKPQDYKTSRWSGGTTTELFIWPKDADYASRAFRLRISSATVDLPESDFTPLAGVQRYILPLQGGFTLTHPGSEPVVMKPWDTPYRFSGEIATHCVGTATDFNLMLKGIEGCMRLCSGETVLQPGIHAFYPGKDGVFSLDGREMAVKQGELLVVITDTPGAVDIGNTQVIHCWADHRS